jgi:chromosome segregation ATPase
MQGEYTGKPIFKHRYLGMSEDDIRQEIDRLQGEVYQLEEMLEAYRRDNVDIHKAVADEQQQNEKLLKSLGLRVQDMHDALDYTKPLKTQMESLLKEFEVNLENLYNYENVKRQKKNVSIIVALTVINTIFALSMTAMIVYLILFA